jgi:hypothetical protein
MKAILTRTIAILASSLLLLAGLLISAPANAATHTVSITIKTNGALDPNGHVFIYTYDTSKQRWGWESEEYTNGSGVALITLTSGVNYRFCYHSDSSQTVEESCWGGDTVEDATTVTLNSNRNLGTVNLKTKKNISMSRVKILGKAVVGQRLTVDLNSLPAGLTDVSIQWYRDGSVSGTGTLLGQKLAKSAIYVVKPGDVGHNITAYVDAWGPHAMAPEYFAGGKPYLTPAVGPVVLPMSFSSAPKIKAKPWKKGKKASYVAPAVTPPGATATFQWLRNGKAIKGARKATYVIKKADRKKKLSLRVTYTYGGYETTTMQSPPSPKIK